MKADPHHGYIVAVPHRGRMYYAPDRSIRDVPPLAHLPNDLRIYDNPQVALARVAELGRVDWVDTPLPELPYAVLVELDERKHVRALAHLHSVRDGHAVSVMSLRDVRTSRRGRSQPSQVQWRFAGWVPKHIRPIAVYLDGQLVGWFHAGGTGPWEGRQATAEESTSHQLMAYGSVRDIWAPSRIVRMPRGGYLVRDGAARRWSFHRYLPTRVEVGQQGYDEALAAMPVSQTPRTPGEMRARELWG